MSGKDVPRVASFGATGTLRLFGISKGGNRYLRRLLLHGARSAVLRVKRERSTFGPVAFWGYISI